MAPEKSTSNLNYSYSGSNSLSALPRPVFISLCISVLLWSTQTWFCSNNNKPKPPIIHSSSVGQWREVGIHPGWDPSPSQGTRSTTAHSFRPKCRPRSLSLLLKSHHSMVPSPPCFRKDGIGQAMSSLRELSFAFHWWLPFCQNLSYLPHLSKSYNINLPDWWSGAQMVVFLACSIQVTIMFLFTSLTKAFLNCMLFNLVKWPALWIVLEGESFFLILKLCEPLCSSGPSKLHKLFCALPQICATRHLEVYGQFFWLNGCLFICLLGGGGG